MKQLLITSRLLGLGALCTLLQSCVFWPDRWREEVYLPSSIPEAREAGNNLEFPGQDLNVFVTASGYEYDLHGPYGITISYPNKLLAVDAITINSFKVSLAGSDLGNISLHHISSRNEVSFGSSLKSPNPDRGSAFAIASERIDLVHVPEEILSVRFELCIEKSAATRCQKIERSFRAVVRKGLFQAVT